jgi:hypothetical protein
LVVERIGGIVNVLLWTIVGVYIIGFVVAGRRGYAWATERPRELRHYVGGRSVPVTRDDTDDKAAAFFVALFWPVVAASVWLRLVLRWTIWAPTPRQRAERQAAELAVVLARAKAAGLDVSGLTMDGEPAPDTSWVQTTEVPHSPLSLPYVVEGR